MHFIFFANLQFSIWVSLTVKYVYTVLMLLDFGNVGNGFLLSFSERHYQIVLKNNRL